MGKTSKSDAVRFSDLPISCDIKLEIRSSALVRDRLGPSRTPLPRAPHQVSRGASTQRMLAKNAFQELVSQKLGGHAKTRTHLKLQHSMPHFYVNRWLPRLCLSEVCCPNSVSEASAAEQ